MGNILFHKYAYKYNIQIQYIQIQMRLASHDLRLVSNDEVIYMVSAAAIGCD